MKEELITENKKSHSTKNPFMLWLARISVRNKFSLIASLIIFILLFSLGSFFFGMKVMSSIRSYVGGEGLWSKAQKEATNYLIKYTDSFNESDYENFLNFLKVPLGDKKARLELEKANPDLSVARVGFIEGGNDPKDVDDLIFLYRKFRHVSYMDKAIQIWTGGDAGISDLTATGDEIHHMVLAYKSANNIKIKSIIISKIPDLVAQTYKTDEQLTILENNFSATLGDGSRGIKNILLWLITLLTILLGAITLFIAYFIAKIIIEIDKAKTEFVFLASHQLRTPPTNMKWFLEMLRSGEVGALNDKQNEYVEEVYKNNLRMITLVNMLLSTSKIELGAFVTKPESINISDTVASILKEYKLQIESKKLAITEKYQSGLPKATIDEKLFRTAIQNIILNAIKYTPVEGAINIEVYLDSKNNSKTSLILKINDTGYGIPKDEFKKIFSKLFRGTNVVKKDTDGTGLGLYLSKSIIDSMHGELWFESEINVGTTFYIRIPLQNSNKK